MSGLARRAEALMAPVEVSREMPSWILVSDCKDMTRGMGAHSLPE